MLKQEMVSVPEAVTNLCAETLVDGALHAALYWSPEGLPPLVQQFYLQAILSLTDHRASGGPRLDFDAPIGGQAVFPATVQNGADAASEAAHRQGDRRNCKHQTAALWAVPNTLCPKVSVGKGAAPVCFNVSNPVGEIQTLAVQFQRSTQGMPHADDAVGALHSCEKSKRPHNVRPQSGKRTVAQRAAEGKIVLPDMEVNPLTAKAGLSNLYLKRLPGDFQMCFRVFQPPRLIL